MGSFIRHWRNLDQLVVSGLIRWHGLLPKCDKGGASTPTLFTLLYNGGTIPITLFTVPADSLAMSVGHEYVVPAVGDQNQNNC